MTRATRTYEFTAFTEADLLQPGDNSIGRGDTFVMPASATTSFSVRDNDRRLSGDIDKKRWVKSEDTGRWEKVTTEHAIDPFGQRATVDGELLDGQIYAEKRHILLGDDGKLYSLIKIEVEGGDAPGKGDDYFAFEGRVPPAGVELKVLWSTDIIFGVKYKKLGAGELGDPQTATIGGRYFCDETTDGIDRDEPPVEGVAVFLRSADGTLIAETRTDSDGLYKFEGLSAGEYIVEFANDPDSGKVFVAPNAGNDSTKDSDVIKVTEEGVGQTAQIAVREGQTIENVDAGVADPPVRQPCSDPSAVLIDFEGLVAGAKGPFSIAGVTITAQRAQDDDGIFDDAMLFDSIVPTGGDTDLQTATQGNVLIISEDGNSEEPNDNDLGGVIIFEFDNPSLIFDILIIDSSGGVIDTFGEDGLRIASFVLPAVPEGEQTQVVMDVAGVTRLEVNLFGDGAVDDLCYIPGLSEPQSTPAIDAFNFA